MKRIALFLIVIAAIAFAILLASSERNRTALLDQEGFITEGSKFGVSISQSTEAAAATLRRSNWKYVDTKNGGYCIRHHYPTGIIILTFFDDGWRQTSLCIGAKNGRIVSIQWYADPFNPQL